MDMPSQVIRKSPVRQPGKEHGFGAMEPLLGALSLLMVIFAGEPLVSLLQDSGHDHLLQNASLISHLEYARQEAVRRETVVTICPSADGRNCQTDGDWQQGWLIFTDATRPYRHLSVGDKFLHRLHSPVDEQPRLAFNIIRYQADGSIQLN
jgi:type IV fimbrial biogenesis protein FimT